MKKNIFVHIILFMMVLLFAGCKNEDFDQQFEIELIVKGKDTEFWRRVEKGATAAKKNYGVSLRVSGPDLEKDYKEQLNYMNKAINRNPDAILLAAGDNELMKSSVDQAEKEGIHVIIIDSGVAGKIHRSYIGTNNEYLGVQLAEATLAKVKEKGTVGIISFVEKSYSSTLRNKGVRQIFENTQWDLLDTVYCDSNIDLAEKQTTKMIQDNPDLVAIMGLNAQSATGAARALKKANRKDIFLGGIDCSVEEDGYIEEGYLDVAVLQNPYLMGYFSVESAYNSLIDKKIEKEIWVESKLVTKNNLFSEENQQLIFPFE